MTPRLASAARAHARDQHGLERRVLHTVLGAFGGAMRLAAQLLRGVVDQVAATLLRQGAASYLNKDCDPDDIVKAIRTVRRCPLSRRGGAFHTASLINHLGLSMPKTLSFKTSCEKCDALTGMAKTACVTDAKAKFGKS